MVLTRHEDAMPADPLTPAVSDRICRHMNVDHASAVLAYAHHYAGLPDASSARMVSVAATAMTLEVDGTTVEVAFDHALIDSEDAHRTLVGMLRSIPGKD
jgi:putative heme iron utilization protein